jgi:hypothetical protein
MGVAVCQGGKIAEPTQAIQRKVVGEMLEETREQLTHLEERQEQLRRRL